MMFTSISKQDMNTHVQYMGPAGQMCVGSLVSVLFKSCCRFFVFICFGIFLSLSFAYFLSSSDLSVL